MGDSGLAPRGTRPLAEPAAAGEPGGAFSDPRGPDAGLWRHLDVGRPRLDLVAQQHFISEGYVQVDGLWAPAFADALAAEAQDRRRVAEIPPTPQGRLRPPIVPASAPSSQTTEASAPILAGLHFALVGLARALSGRMLVPAFAVYNYYEVDDGVWLHVDAEECEVTLLTAALGDVGPLRVHPGLRGSTLDELARIERDPAWSDDGGVPIPYLRLGVTALRGKLLPHHRPGRPVASASAVAALHYCPLF